MRILIKGRQGIGKTRFLDSIQSDRLVIIDNWTGSKRDHRIADKAREDGKTLVATTNENVADEPMFDLILTASTPARI